MIERIKRALERCGVSLWRINERVDETAELFFVKKQLDTRRIKDVRKYDVTVFRDVESGDGGKPARGATSVPILPSMDDRQLDEELKGAYYAAQFAANPYYDDLSCRISIIRLNLKQGISSFFSMHKLS